MKTEEYLWAFHHLECIIIAVSHCLLRLVHYLKMVEITEIINSNTTSLEVFPWQPCGSGNCLLLIGRIPTAPIQQLH